MRKSRNKHNVFPNHRKSEGTVRSSTRTDCDQPEGEYVRNYLLPKVTV